jgi:hypothetical protein
MKEFPDLESSDFAGMLALLEDDDTARPGTSAFYEPLSQEYREQWLT